MYEGGKKLFALLKEKEVRELIELVIDYSLEVNDVIMEARTADKDLASKTYVLEKLSK